MRHSFPLEMPEHYVAGRADAYFNEFYPAEKGPKDSTGVWELLSDKRTSMIPQSLERMGRREKYDSNPAHSSLKDKRELREKLKEKKYKLLHENLSKLLKTTNQKV